MGGAVGRIAAFDGKGNAVVKYLDDRHTRRVSLTALRYAPHISVGDEVVWAGLDKETTQGAVGTVVSMDETKAEVRFRDFGDAYRKGHRRRLPIGELIVPADAPDDTLAGHPG